MIRQAGALGLLPIHPTREYTGTSTTVVTTSVTEQELDGGGYERVRGSVGDRQESQSPREGVGAVLVPGVNLGRP